MSDLTETTSEESVSPVFFEIYDTNAQFPSPIPEPKDIKEDESSSVLAAPQVMPAFDSAVFSTKDAEIQTDLSFPFDLPNDVQNVLNAFTVMAELSSCDSLSSDSILIDSSGSEYLQQNPFSNSDIPSPPLTDEDLKILYESLSSSERLDGDVFQTALQDYRILSPPLSDIETEVMLPEDLEVLKILSGIEDMEDS